ncbi:MAG: hypothetical protein J6Y43_04180 [Clostridia bacterium]|nr:hypothetical protein [Clostridia bacterium]
MDTPQDIVLAVSDKDLPLIKQSSTLSSLSVSSSFSIVSSTLTHSSSE